MVCKLQSASYIFARPQLSFAASAVPREICTACHKVQCSFEKPRIEDASSRLETKSLFSPSSIQEFIRNIIIMTCLTYKEENNHQ